MKRESTAGSARTNTDASHTDNRDCRLCGARADGVVVRRDGSTMPICRACGRAYGERDDREVAADGGTADADLFCNECATPLRWGGEYQLDYGDDFDAVCSDCYHDAESSDDLITDGGTAQEDARPADGLTVLSTRLRGRADRIEVAAGRAPEGRLARDDQEAVVESVREAIDDLRRVLDVVDDADREVGGRE